MSASKYLPPFTADERSTLTGDRPARTPTGPTTTSSVPTAEATYADFLGDEVDGSDPSRPTDDRTPGA